MTTILLDPALRDHNGSESTNIGDSIISLCTHRELRKIQITPDVELPTHSYPRIVDVPKLQNANLTFVGGSNLLSFHPIRRRNWKIGPIGLMYYRDLILLGTGWGAYNRAPSAYTKIVLSHILSKKFKHSVRDAYTKRILGNIGIVNVINTSCPTMWSLIPEHVKSIPINKSDSCVISFTSSSPNPDFDREVIEKTKKSYEKVYLWPQGVGDEEYARKLGYTGHSIERSLVSYTRFLNEYSSKCDYIGSRLHGGIYALLHKCRAHIISIDNRAHEIARDCGLPIFNRARAATLDGLGIVDCRSIRIPENNISEWKNQFHHSS